MGVPDPVELFVEVLLGVGVPLELLVGVTVDVLERVPDGVGDLDFVLVAVTVFEDVMLAVLVGVLLLVGLPDRVTVPLLVVVPL